LRIGWWREWCSSIKRSPSISTRPALMVFRDEMPGANWDSMRVSKA